MYNRPLFVSCLIFLLPFHLKDYVRFKILFFSSFFFPFFFRMLSILIF